MPPFWRSASVRAPATHSDRRVPDGSVTGAGARASARSIAPGEPVHAASTGAGSPAPQPAAASASARAVSAASLRAGMARMLWPARRWARGPRPYTPATGAGAGPRGRRGPGLPWSAVRRSSYDREIVTLALPALGALAAEPLYLLADTAIVGHLGTPQLAALALAATVLSTVVSLCIFLTYGTTARVSRLHGAGQDRAAAALAPQALWLALGIGVTVAAAVAALAVPLVHGLGGAGEVGANAVRYLRIASLGVPMALIALAGQGFLRGVGDLRTPLMIVVAANATNVVLELLFVYGFDWGLDGSAWGTVVAQAGMGVAFVTALLRAPAERRAPDWERIRSLVSIGAQLFVRTAGLLGCFVFATSICARIGQASLGAPPIAFQLFGSPPPPLDAIAIAGQVIGGRALGAGDAEAAYAAARRMVEWSIGAGLLIGGVLLALID